MAAEASVRSNRLATHPVRNGALRLSEIDSHSAMMPAGTRS